jgi:ATP-dependent Clp endopeptidase proteolytic subunit ClpP
VVKVNKVPHNLIFNFKNVDDEMVIDVNGIIGDEWDDAGITAKRFANEIHQFKGSTIRMRINSAGGLVPDALQIYDLMKGHDAEVITEVYGATASAGTIINQGASNGKRRMSANALMLIHLAWGVFQGNKEDLQTSINALDKFDALINEIYLKNGADPEITKQLMGESGGHGIWISAIEAKEAGLIDEIFEGDEAMNVVDHAMINKIGLPKAMHHTECQLVVSNEFTEPTTTNDVVTDSGSESTKESSNEENTINVNAQSDRMDIGTIIKIKI